MAQDRSSAPIPSQLETVSKPNHKLLVIVGAGVALGCLVLLCVMALVAAGVLGSVWTRSRADTRVTPLVRFAVVTLTSLPVATATPLQLVGTPTQLLEFTRTPSSPPVAPVVRKTPAVTLTNSVSVTPEITARQLRVFEKLWDIVNTDYIYPDFHGMDWDALRVNTLDKIKGGIDDERFYDLMRHAIDGLNDHHSSYLSPQEAREEQQDYAGAGNYTGIGIISDINPDKRYAYVLQVLPGSPAEQAGIRSHEHILSINGKPSVVDNDDTNMPLLRGPVGTTVTITVSALNGKPRTLVIKRAKLSTSTPVEHHTIISGTKRIGYVMIPTLFEDSVGDEVRAALDDLMKKGRLDGLIIDMRINGGGAYPVLMRCLGFFTSGAVGSLTNRSGVQKTLIVRTERVGNSQTVPVMVLVGHATASYAEVYAGILRSAGRAKLVGQSTGGNIETLRAHDFEDGSLAWIAEETFQLSDGSNWEGKGLTPDIKVDKAWDEITDESDPAIAAALKAF
jgi:carboxyl-terminal processing protease